MFLSAHVADDDRFLVFQKINSKNACLRRYATMAAAMQHEPRNTTGLDSMNMLPVLTGTTSQARAFMLQDSCVAQDGNQNIRAFREDSWFYIGNTRKDQSGDINHREPEWFQEMHNATRKLKGASIGYDELFNLAADLGQSTNLIRNQNSRAKTMQATMNRLWEIGTRSVPSFLPGKSRDPDQPGIARTLPPAPRTNNIHVSDESPTERPLARKRRKQSKTLGSRATVSAAALVWEAEERASPRAHGRQRTRSSDEGLTQTHIPIKHTKIV
jgi:hypothetical protein